MKKGKWIFNLLSRVLKGDIAPAEGLSFGLARAKPKPLNISMEGMTFEDADHILWSALADVFINRVYLPSNFFISPIDIVVDIGAHRGAFTSFAARRTEAKVIAIEPNPLNFSLLKLHIDRNNLRNVELHNAAIGHKSGNSNLFITSSSSRHSLYESQVARKDVMQQIEVNVLSLDDCLSDFEIVDLVKMDCEGAEIDIIMKSEEKTLYKIQKLAVETHYPIVSKEMVSLLNRVKAFFSNTVFVDQQQESLGYLYAWK